MNKVYVIVMGLRSCPDEDEIIGFLTSKEEADRKRDELEAKIDRNDWRVARKSYFVEEVKRL